MLFLEVTVIFLVLSTCRSQNPDKQKVWNDPVDGTFINQRLNNDPFLRKEGFIDNRKIAKSERLVREIQQEEITGQGKDAQIKSLQGFRKDFISNNGELIYPPKNATYKASDLKYQQSGQIHAPPACIKNNFPLINGLDNKDKAIRILTRDVDTFSDNALIDKVLNYNEQVSNKLRVKTAKNEPVYKGFLDGDSLKKRRGRREATSQADYDYYYEDKSVEETSAAKGGLANIKQKFSKIIKPKEQSKITSKLNTEVTEFSSGKDSTNNNIISDSPVSTESNYDAVSSINETASVANSNNQISDEIVTLTDQNDSVEVEENSNIKSVLKRKDTCRFGKNEGANCLPQGGIPKNPAVQFLGTNRDSEYDKLIKGDITDKLLKTILQKVKGNSDIASKLGICDYDIKEIKDLYNTVRNKQNECCMKLKGEFKCFLNWLLTIDPSRKKRSTNIDQIRNGKVNTAIYGEKNSYPIYLGGPHKPSPQYQKLFEKVQRYKEENSDTWNFSPDGFELPDSSINI